jgi:hypothetical protein
MMKFSFDETQKPGALRRYGKWWPVLLGPLTIVLVYIARLFNLQWLFSRTPNENIALVLLGISLTGFIINTIIFRSEFHLFMAALCGAFFCREWHFPGTSKGIYIALALLAFWALKRRKELEKFIAKSLLKIWIPCTFGTYFLSQLIARRAFRSLHLPLEAQIHVPLEESVETIAHIMMIVVCLIAFKAKPEKVKKFKS